MKKFFFLFIVSIVTFSQSLFSQNLDEVLKNHFEAVGQDKLQKVESIVTTCQLSQMGVEIPFKLYTKRPGLLRFEGTFQGLTFIQTYNGSEAWMVEPLSGSTDPQPMTADQMRELKIQADMDGMMWNWKEKGYTVTLDSTEDIEGTKCYKVTTKTTDGGTYTNYIDSDSYMIIKSKSKTMITGAEVESETFMSNYMMVEGIAFPGKIENRYNGVTDNIIVVQKVELNTPLENTIFDKPASN